MQLQWRDNVTPTDLLATFTVLPSMFQESLSGVSVGHETMKWSEKFPSFVRAVLVLYLLPLNLIIRHFSLGIDGRRDQPPLRTWDFEYFHQIISKAHTWKSVNLDIGFDRCQREPWFLHFPFSVILPYRLFKGDILFFCIITQQYWWLASQHTHFPDRLPLLHL